MPGAQQAPRRRSSGIALAESDPARNAIRSALMIHPIGSVAPPLIDPLWLSPDDTLILAVTAFGRAAVNVIPVLDDYPQPLQPVTYENHVPIGLDSEAVGHPEPVTNERGYGGRRFLGFLHLADVAQLITEFLDRPEAKQHLPQQCFSLLQSYLRGLHVSDILQQAHQRAEQEDKGSAEEADEKHRYWSGQYHTVYSGDLSTPALPVCRSLLRLGSTVKAVAVVRPLTDELLTVVDDTCLIRWIHQQREEIGLTVPSDDPQAAKLVQGRPGYIRRASWGGIEAVTMRMACSVVNAPLTDVFTSRPVLAVSRSEPMWSVLRKMLKAGSDFAAVVDENGSIITNISRSDLKICLCGGRPPERTFLQLQGMRRYMGPYGATYTNCIAPGPLTLQLSYLSLPALDFISISRQLMLEARVPSLELGLQDTVLLALTKLAATGWGHVYITSDNHIPLSAVNVRDILQAVAGSPDDGGLTPESSLPLSKQEFSCRMDRDAIFHWKPDVPSTPVA